MKKKTDAQNVTIFFESIAREQQELQIHGLAGKQNWLKHIVHPGGGIVITGDDGWEALWSLTESVMRIGKIDNRTKREAVKTDLAKVLFRKFQTEGLQIDQRNVARALNETSRGARRSFRTQTHYIPCHLSTNAEAVGLDVGPVRFISRIEARTEFREALKKKSQPDPKFAKIYRKHLFRAIRHYSGFQWFARVTVADCDAERSAAIALASASSALDFLQLLLGADGSHRMSILGQQGSYQPMSSIARNDTSGSLNISTKWNAAGVVALPSGWTEQILDGERRIGFEKAGIILESRVNPDLERPLSLRLLDAVQWFGEATRDPSPSTRIIKYVTALERLTLTKKVENVAESVSRRVAALTTGYIGELSFEEIITHFKKIYDIRSGLVHGSISPNDSRVKKFSGKACSFSEIALRRVLYNLTASMLVDTVHQPADLDRWFEWMARQS